MYVSWGKVRANCILTPVEGGGAGGAFKDIAKTDLEEIEYITM
jgi:hypothetical protein